MLDPTVMRRLSFIKYLYETGVEQSRRPEPMNAVSLLTFHDSIELFLRLASEQKDAAAKTDLKFLDYWDVLKHKVQGGLTQKESVRRLDSARGNLKHQGTRPSKEDVEEYRVTAKRFFEDNTPLVFDVPFADVSMIKIVQLVLTPVGGRTRVSDVNADEGSPHNAGSNTTLPARVQTRSRPPCPLLAE